jgi:glutathionylspermidine synthase
MDARLFQGLGKEQKEKLKGALVAADQQFNEVRKILQKELDDARHRLESTNTAGEFAVDVALELGRIRALNSCLHLLNTDDHRSN